MTNARRWLKMEEKQFRAEKPKNDEGQSLDVSQLNLKQREAYDVVTQWVTKKLECPNCCESLFLNISGRAGCGKSFWLKKVKKFIEFHARDNEQFIKVAAPTANAAFIVEGTTLHSLFKIPPKLSKDKEMKELRGENLRKLQDEFRGTELIVIDEKSMVGLHMLYMIHKRLTEIKCSPKLFGGVSLILMGDFAQLPPVKDKPLYDNVIKDLNLFQAQGSNLFQEFNNGRTIIFNEIMRQQGESQNRFKEILNSLADGSFDKAGWMYLKERDLFLSDKFSKDDQREFLASATLITSTNKVAKEYNCKRIKQLGTNIALVQSDNNCPEAANASFNKAGLPKSIMLAKGCDVVLTRNLWKEVGLTNGAKGKVKYIIYAKGEKLPNLPRVVIVEFEQYTGPDYLGMKKCVPIIPTSNTWYNDSQKQCIRTMLPLILGYGITIHKSQGQSMDKVLIDIGKKEFACGLTYTAISRCRKIEDLAFLPFFNLPRFQRIKTAKVFKQRREQDKEEQKSDNMFED